MSHTDLKQLAAVVRLDLPSADIRTDQCNILRVYHANLLGSVGPLPDGRFALSVTDLTAMGEISGVASQPIAKAVVESPIDAARLLARELKRLAKA